MSRVEGLDQVLSSMNRELSALKTRTMAGLWDAGLQIQRVAQQELQASVVTGNLRGSAYTRRSGQFQRLDDSRLDRERSAPDPRGQVGGVEIGFTAIYALRRHEDMEGRAPKFLENPIRRNQSSILKIIQKRAEMGR